MILEIFAESWGAPTTMWGLENYMEVEWVLNSTAATDWIKVAFHPTLQPTVLILCGGEA